MHIVNKIDLIKMNTSFKGSLTGDKIHYRGMGWYDHQIAMIYINNDMQILRDAQIGFILIEGTAIDAGNSTILKLFV